MNGIRESLDRIASREVDSNLPKVSAADNGKVCKVVAGVWAKAAEAVELPAVTAADAGKVLTVNAEGVWVAAALPEE